MNYKKIHDNIIHKAKNRVLDNVYTEKHHIVPKCLGGNNDKNNIVKLLPKEHLLIHKLLVRIHPEEYKLAYALFAMTLKNKYTKNRKNISIKEYAYIKEQMSLATKKRLKNNNVWVGKKHTKVARKKQSESAKKRKIQPAAKKIYQYDLNMNFIKEWKSITDAAKHFNISVSGITTCAKGRQKTAAGFKWNYNKN